MRREETQTRRMFIKGGNGDHRLIRCCVDCCQCKYLLHLFIISVALDGIVEIVMT